MTPGHEDANLQRSLKSRHLTMIAVGGVIGAGFFLGVGEAISKAGPAVILAYIAGGILTLFILLLLVEMAASHPVAGSFQEYASEALGPRAGFATGWTYWAAFLIGPASETIAAGTFLHAWFPAVPIWVFALVVAVVMTVVNLIGVLVFGEVEFWLSLIKVLALVAFIVWGAIALFGLSPSPVPSVTNLVNDSGFAPAGAVGVLGALLIVMFAYGGTESIGTAAEESEDPARDMPKIVRSTILRIVVLFIVSVTVLVAVLPWRDAGVSSSPFVDATSLLGGPVAANVMNFVVLIAALSTIDAGIYATSRMLYSMSRGGYFPKVFSHVHPRSKTPIFAILVSCAVLFLGAGLYLLFPDFAYVWLASLSGFGFMFAWLMIALSQPGIRRRVKSEGELKWRAPGTPYIQWAALTLILLTFAGQFFIEGGWKMIATGAVWIAFTLVYFETIGKRRFLAHHRPGPSGGDAQSR